VPGNGAQQQRENNSFSMGTISWWTWRPGIRPQYAHMLGVLLSVLALLFIAGGIVTLVLGILDGYSPPVQIPGTVIGRSTNSFDNSPQLIIRIQRAGSTATIKPAVTSTTFQAIQDGDHIIIDYSQHLHFLYALESASGQRYTLPGASAFGNPFGSVALLLLGLVLLPYPVFLALWGWRDLYSRHDCTIRARIVGLRSSKQSRTARPGLTSRIARSSHVVALEPIHGHSSQEVMTFTIKEEMYHSLREGMIVQVTYSPHLHYVYALKQSDEGH
jgi:hypothetical protein